MKFFEFIGQLTTIVGTSVGAVVSVLQLVKMMRRRNEDNESDKESKLERQGRDKTKYRLDGGEKLYGKGRLVHAVVTKYVAKNPNCSSKGLKQVFPDEWQGRRLIRTTTDKIWLDKKKCLHDFFATPDEIIDLRNGEEVIVSSQWGIGNIGRFLSGVRSLGFRVDEVVKS